MSPESVYQAILKVALSTPCDAVFVSCTNVRTLEILDRAETTLGIPVISSNQALAWHMLRLAGLNAPVTGYGQLLRLGPSQCLGTEANDTANAMKGA